MTETSGTVRALSMSLVILSAGCVPDETEDAPVSAGEVAQVDADDSAFTYSIIDQLPIEPPSSRCLKRA